MLNEPSPLFPRPLVDGDQIAHLRSSQGVCRRCPRQTTGTLVGLQLVTFVQLARRRSQRSGYEGIRVEVGSFGIHVSWRVAVGDMVSLSIADCFRITLQLAIHHPCWFAYQRPHLESIRQGIRHGRYEGIHQHDPRTRDRRWMRGGQASSLVRCRVCRCDVDDRYGWD
jgi:hypothetical protein